MPSLSCPRCGLRIKVKAAFLLIENCPRCIGRRRIIVPLVLHPPADREPTAVSNDTGSAS